MKKLSRRQVLGPLGIVAGTCALSSCLTDHRASEPDTDKEPTFPWTYSELDPDITAGNAYDDCVKGHCMYGVFAPVMSQLAVEHGDPYRSFPIEMMRYGAGGAGAWGSLCGALNGAGALMGLFAQNEEQMKQMMDELYLWYEQTSLPVYVPDRPRFDLEIPTSISNSVLCHVSVTQWCKVSGHKAFSEPRKERCTRLSADVAKKTVEILNSCCQDRFVRAQSLSQETKTCRSCHTKGSEKSNSRGKMSCNSCHFTLASDHPSRESI
jgi:hypothetical protein